MSNKQFFNPTTEEEKKDVLKIVAGTHLSCVIKLLDQFYKSEFVSFSGSQIKIKKKNRFKVTQQKLTVQFEHNADQYLFSVVADSDDENYFFDIPEFIYVIQRRNDFRVSLPSSINPILKLKKYPDLKTQILDISLGGMKFNVQTQFNLEYKMEEEILADLKLISFDEKNFPMTIRFLKFEPEQKVVQIGGQFSNLDNDQTTSLRSVLLQIDRILRGKNDD